MVEQRESVYETLDAWRSSGYQDGHEKLAVEARRIVAELDVDEIEALRNAKKGKGHPGIAKILADELSPSEWKALMRDTIAQSALSKRFLTKTGLAAFYKMLAWPLILVFHLPPLNDKKANAFGEYAALWAQAYAPFGIPLLHHLMLLGLFLDGLMDCFLRKRDGERGMFDPPKKPKEDTVDKKTPEKEPENAGAKKAA